MELTLVEASPDDATAIGVPVAQDDTGSSELSALGVSADFLSQQGFEGKVGQKQVVARDGATIVVLGVGPADAVTPTILRRAAASFVRSVSKHETVATTLVGAAISGGEAAAAQAIAEGALLGNYQYLTYKSDPKAHALAAVAIVGSGDDVSAAVSRGETIATAAAWVRDLVNAPGGDLTPPAMADAATAMAEEVGLDITVWGKDEIEAENLGGILGVNRGSDLPPRFLTISYVPEGEPTGHVALVGKGITFDSGGLSIKLGAGMMTMKCDMGGAGAVLGAMRAIAGVKPACRVTGYVAATDNMLGGDATRPGDVLKTRNGKTIEVLNTDAEGRLVLADALAVASEASPDAIIDLATLTGACMVALGPKIAGVMGTSDELIDQLRAASEASGERIWELPLPDDYRKMVDSPIADMKNIGGPHGGAITAGLILKEFVEDGIAWAHLDIAGPAFTDSDDAEITKGGTGFGVRLLTEMVDRFVAPS